MNEVEARKAYEEQVKPLVGNKGYAEASRLLSERPELKDYLSKEELKALFDYSQRVISKLAREILNGTMEIRDDLQRLVVKDELGKLGVRI